MEKLLKDPRNLITLGIVAITVVALLGALLYGICCGLWYLSGLLTETDARLWVIISTLLIPATAVATWKLALRYERGLIKGLDLGVGKVAKAGKDAATLRVSVHNAIKRPPVQPQPPTDQWQVQLPDVQIVPRLPSGQDVIEL